MIKRWHWEKYKADSSLGHRQRCWKVSMSRRREYSLASAAKAWVGVYFGTSCGSLAGRTDTWSQTLVCTRNFPKSLVKDANFLAPCAEGLGVVQNSTSRMRTLGWFQSRWPPPCFGKTQASRVSWFAAAPQTPSSQTNSVQVTFQRWKCWLLTVLWWFKLDKILLCRFCIYVHGAWHCAATYCSKLTHFDLCPSPSASWNPHLATEVRHTILILFVGKFKLKK